MLYLSAEFFFLDHIVFVTDVFSFVAILYGVNIKFDITSEFVCVSPKWLGGCVGGEGGSGEKNARLDIWSQ